MVEIEIKLRSFKSSEHINEKGKFIDDIICRTYRLEKNAILNFLRILYVLCNENHFNSVYLSIIVRNITTFSRTVIHSRCSFIVIILFLHFITFVLRQFRMSVTKHVNSSTFYFEGN